MKPCEVIDRLRICIHLGCHSGFVELLHKHADNDDFVDAVLVLSYDAEFCAWTYFGAPDHSRLLSTLRKNDWDLAAVGLLDTIRRRLCVARVKLGERAPNK